MVAMVTGPLILRGPGCPKVLTVAQFPRLSVVQVYIARVGGWEP